MWVQSIKLPAAVSHSQQRFYIYRGELECTVAPGNKQHKLRHHLSDALTKGYSRMATFGGPHSNHIAAFVARCKTDGIQPILVVRGETCIDLTPTLRHAVEQGAMLFPSTRKEYRLGLQSDIKHSIDDYFDHQVYWVPEGGSGQLGFLGCLDWANEILNKVTPDVHVCIASGTGTTAAAFAASPFAAVSVFSALKGVADVASDIASLCAQYGEHVHGELHGYDESDHGGFGKVSPKLIQFLKTFRALNPNIQLDPVYTSKMLFKVNELVELGRWHADKTLFVHTGGLQGWQGIGASKNPYLSVLQSST